MSAITAFRVGLGRTRELLANARVHATTPDDFTLHGVRLRLDGPWVTPTLRAAIYDEWYEALEAAIVTQTVRRGDRVIDLGCGIGLIGTLASRLAGEPVRCYDANPRMVTVAQATLARNRAPATVTSAVLMPRAKVDATTFYVHNDFWASSLTPHPNATAITVPVLDIAIEISALEASYLIVDIEGGETDLLVEPLPGCVRKVCVECHPAVSRASALSAMLSALLAQGFAISLEHSKPPVLYFSR